MESGGEVQIWRAAQFRAMPWRNGGGVSHEIATSPPDAGLGDFDWRLSLADVAAGGPFSRFEGVDRVIVLLEGTAMRLTVDGHPHLLVPGSPLAFSGDSVTTCELPDGPTRDLNVMTRRGRTSCRVNVLDVSDVAEGESGLTRDVAVGPRSGGSSVVVFVVDGAVTVYDDRTDRVELGRHDAVRIGEPGPVRLAGRGRAVVIRLVGDR